MGFLLYCLALAQAGDTGSVHVRVVDQKGRPVENSVVVLHGAGTPAALPTNREGRVRIVQKDREFSPYVTVIRTGMAVEFPNEDTVQHHIYSFSETKPLDIPLYKDEMPPPVVFEKPGLVTLGCNIHDWMKAYLFVTGAEYYGKTDGKGDVTMTSVGTNSFSLEVWHPRLRKLITPLPDAVDVTAGATVELAVEMDLKKEWAPPRPPDRSSDEY